jgi:predicted signal transduction protein with EAL and GGDEF domain
MTFEWWLQTITIKGLTFIRAELAIYLSILVIACIFEYLWLNARKKLKQLNKKVKDDGNHQRLKR